MIRYKKNLKAYTTKAILFSINTSYELISQLYMCALWPQYFLCLKLEGKLLLEC
jgi:hypothetical protein